MGRVVISTGKIKTDCSREIKNETIGDEAETQSEWYSGFFLEKKKRNYRR